MNVVLVGHKGYIGAFLYEHLKTNSGVERLRGYDVKDGNEHRGEHVTEIDQADIVIYLAGLSGRKQCLAQPEQHKFQENVVDIMTVGSKMKPGSLLIYASTASLYEGYGAFPADETALLNTHLFDEYTYSMYLREHQHGGVAVRDRYWFIAHATHGFGPYCHAPFRGAERRRGRVWRKPESRDSVESGFIGSIFEDYRESVDHTRKPHL